MSVVVIGDSHGSRPMLREALRLAQQLGCGTVVSVGDFGVWPGPTGREFLDAVDLMASQRDVCVLVVPGNHDDYDQIGQLTSRDDGWLLLRDRILVAPRPHRFELDGLTWLAVSGAASADGPGGIFDQVRGPLDRSATVTDGRGRLRGRQAGFDLGGWWPQERIAPADVVAAIDLIDTVHRDGQRIDVMVSHEAPLVLPVGPVGDWQVGLEQRRLLQQVHDHALPTVHVCGHWHRHVTAASNDRYLACLSADINPAEPQWAIIEPDDHGRPVVVAPRRWSPATALTALVEHQARRHRLDPNLARSDLATCHPSEQRRQA